MAWLSFQNIESGQSLTEQMKAQSLELIRLTNENSPDGILAAKLALNGKLLLKYWFFISIEYGENPRRTFLCLKVILVFLIKGRSLVQLVAVLTLDWIVFNLGLGFSYLIPYNLRFYIARIGWYIQIRFAQTLGSGGIMGDPKFESVFIVWVALFHSMMFNLVQPFNTFLLPCR